MTKCLDVDERNMRAFSYLIGVAVRGLSAGVAYALKKWSWKWGTLEKVFYAFFTIQ